MAAATNMMGILVALYGAELGGMLTVLVMVPLLLLFGEVMPKTITASPQRMEKEKRNKFYKLIPAKAGGGQ